jgi:hypothetical protein
MNFKTVIFMMELFNKKQTPIVELVTYMKTSANEDELYD